MEGRKADLKSEKEEEEQSNKNSDHNAYEKMVESTQSWYSVPGKKDEKWIVLEKVHGSNFCFILEESENEETENNVPRIRYAKRSDFLTENDEFFGFQTILEKYIPKLRKLWQTLIETHSNKQNDNNNIRILKKCEIYGELFGGKYPDFELAADIEPVQVEILYCPYIEFYVFDLALSFSNIPRDYMNWDEAMKLLETCEFFYAKPLFTGSFQQCLNFSVKFETTIPSRLGLKNFPNNMAEGVVIKPLRNLYAETKKGPVRAILKNKSELFSEKVLIQSNKKLSSVQQIEEEALGFITKQRLIAVISKLGKSKQMDKLNLTDLLVKDACQAMADDESFSIKWQNTKKELILPKLQTKARKLVFEYLQK